MKLGTHCLIEDATIRYKYGWALINIDNMLYTQSVRDSVLAT
jgi:hypothetical protein